MTARYKRSIAAQRVMPTWAPPANLYSTDPFRIDAIIGALPASPRLPSKELEREFGRRGLDVAIHSAAGAQADDLTPIIQEWAALADAAMAACDGLQRLNRRLGPNDRAPAHAREMVQALQTSKALKAGDVEAARSAADLLWSAHDLTRRLSASAAAMRANLARTHQNSGDAPYRAFATIIGEVWVHLTGTRPTANKQGCSFTRFLEAAWFDAGGSVVASPDGTSTLFLRGAQWAREAFPGDEIPTRLNGVPYWWP